MCVSIFLRAVGVAVGRSNFALTGVASRRKADRHRFGVDRVDFAIRRGGEEAKEKESARCGKFTLPETAAE
jgi:hypothetical protein